MNLRRRYRFRERERGIFHQRPAHQRYEQYAEHAAHQHQRCGFPIGLGGIERSPGTRHDERRNREDGARRHSLADGARGARDVFLEHRTFESAQKRHADDRSRIRGRDGLAGVQAEIGVGRSQHHSHHQA